MANYKPLARVAPIMAFFNLNTAQVTPSGNAGAVTRQGTESDLGFPFLGGETWA